MIRPTSTERVLLVEGQDDEHVVGHLCMRRKKKPTWIFIQKNGKDELLKSLSPEIKQSGRNVVGIVIDADNSLRSRWKAISSELSKLNIRTPPKPTPNGVVIEGKPRIGIWLMPDNKSAGELEDFVAAMIPASDPIWSLSEAYIDGIPLPYRKFAPKKTLRAKVHAWLATRREPRRMALAIKTKDLDINVEISQKFAAWLEKLFE